MFRTNGDARDYIKPSNSSALTAANSIAPIALPPISICNSSKNTTVPNPQKAHPAPRKKPGFCDNFCGLPKIKLRNPVSVLGINTPSSFSTKMQYLKVLAKLFKGFLTRFDATICAIADSPYPTIPTFSPQDPHLIQTIMNWLQRIILEA